MWTLVLALSVTTIADAATPTSESAQPASRSAAPLRQHGGAETTALWAKAVTPYLKKPLWQGRAAYDAGHFLMVPLHAAFLLDEPSWRQELLEHAESFARAPPQQLADNRLSRLQYLYLWSRFLVLAEQTGAATSLPTKIRELLYAEVHRFWRGAPAEQWNFRFERGLEERVTWKLSRPTVRLSYHRAFTDEELTLFAIASDLVTYESLTGLRFRYSGAARSARDAARVVVENAGTWTSTGGWLFQPGAWADHTDYAFAGHSAKPPTSGPKRLPGIAWDTSHSHRFPLWLRSIANSYKRESQEHRALSRIIAGLERQFFGQVVQPPSPDFPWYRTRNYMDGSNGVYRWKYPSHPSDGYGPFQTSGTLLLGWWGFLGTPRAALMYASIAASYPLPRRALLGYLTPGQEVILTNGGLEASTYANGSRQLNAILASKLAALQLRSLGGM